MEAQRGTRTAGGGSAPPSLLALETGLPPDKRQSPLHLQDLIYIPVSETRGQHKGRMCHGVGSGGRSGEKIQKRPDRRAHYRAATLRLLLW